ncbi:MAG: outer membrane lipoprotein-sorting protein [Treponema sp.]|nr:outer membrane lipoprotein-sorting protein [Treponema sp.]
MKKNIMFLTLFVCMFANMYAQSAESIVSASRDRIKSDTVSTRSRMVIRAKNGSTSDRLIDQYSKKGPKGDRTVIIFQEPRSVAGTRFLTMENPGSADDRWIFLPELGKIRRVAASEGSGSFMGTDFSYEDISSASRSISLDTHTLLREENLNGIDGKASTQCYVIQSVPKDSSYQYSKMIQWITKDDNITVKIDLYDKKNALVKTIEMSGFKEIQGRLPATVTKMSTHAAGTSTTITMEIIKYDDPIPDRVFTTSFLETGK